jgi:hypothetical protein
VVVVDVVVEEDVVVDARARDAGLVRAKTPAANKAPTIAPTSTRRANRRALVPLG